jgi:hypothetical protein
VILLPTRDAVVGVSEPNVDSAVAVPVEPDAGPEVHERVTLAVGLPGAVPILLLHLVADVVGEQLVVVLPEVFRPVLGDQVDVLGNS